MASPTHLSIRQALFLILALAVKPGISFQIHSSPKLRMRSSNSATSTFLQVIAGPGSDNADPVLLLPLMEAELHSITNSGEGMKSGEETESEEVSLSMRIRQEYLKEEIDNARTAAEFGVRKIQLEFYDAFCNQDIEKMDAVWSDNDPSIRCIHPGMGAIYGKEKVMQSWNQVFQSGKKFQIGPTRVEIEICGKTALCSCIEEQPGGAGPGLEAFNIYRREGGEWRMISHMASPIIISTDM
jgi:hypothetical protein